MKILLILWLLTSLLIAKSIEEDFLSTLNSVDHMIYKERLNIDNVPLGMRVIRKEFIQKCGAQTLYELLEFVPGIEISRSSSGKVQLVVRGIKSKYRDKIKLLIDGVDVTNNLVSNQFQYYFFPAALIKRLEITLSPDSILYGSNAFIGVINVITLDSDEKSQASFTLSTNSRYQTTLFVKKDRFLFDIHLYRSHPELFTPQTVLIDLQQHSSNLFRESTRANNLEKSFGFGIRYQKDNINLTYRNQYLQKGSFFGFSNLPPLKNDKKAEIFHQYLNLTSISPLNSSLKLLLNLGVKNFQGKWQMRSFPYDLSSSSTQDKDIIVGSKINEIEGFLEPKLHYIDRRHNLTFGLHYKYAKPTDSYYQQYVEFFKDQKNQFNLGPYGEHLTGSTYILRSGISRKVYGLFFEDLYSFNEQLSAIYGLRYDHYSDKFQSNLSYKAGLTYTTGQKSIKLLYNHAYRAPSWVELYAKSIAEFHGNEDLKAETIDMVELSYIQELSSTTKFSIDLYYQYQHNAIQRVLSYPALLDYYQNIDTIISKGLEIGFSKEFKDIQTALNISYNHTDMPNMVNKGLNGSRDLLCKASLDIPLGSLHSFSFFEYGSMIKTPPYSADVPSYWWINQIFNYQYKNLFVQFGVKNIFSKTRYYWIEPTDVINHRYMFEPIESRVPEAGREFFITLTKSF